MGYKWGHNIWLSAAVLNKMCLEACEFQASGQSGVRWREGKSRGPQVTTSSLGMGFRSCWGAHGGTGRNLALTILLWGGGWRQNQWTVPHCSHRCPSMHVICSHHCWAHLPRPAPTFKQSEEQGELCSSPAFEPAHDGRGKKTMVACL